MYRQEAKSYCRAHTAELLKPSKRKGSQHFYCCELCGSGLHGTASSDGALTIGKVEGHLHCFSCGFDGDIFDYMADLNGVARGTVDAFNMVYDMFNIDIENDKSGTAAASSVFSNLEEQPVKEQEPEADYTERYRLWAANLEKCSYLLERGISLDVAKKYGLGYGEIYFTQLRGKEMALIIPTSRGSYTARNTNRETEAVQRYQKKGGNHFFNERALASNEYVFVTEGELDALSILQAGGQAVGLGSLSNIDSFLTVVKKYRGLKGLILCLDNDKVGVEAAKAFPESLKAAGLGHVPCFALNVVGACKDANELLRKAPDVLAANVAEAKASPFKAQYKQKHKSDRGALGDFWEHVHDQNRGRVYSTGFFELDAALGGGIGTGLTGLGAISALGKTTLAVQIANNIAKQGNDVLFFSLELGRDELIAKTLSRLTAAHSVSMYGNTEHASTAREILSGWNWHTYHSKKQDLIYYSKRVYEDYADRIYTVEGEMEYTVEDITARVAEHIQATGNRPVVFVDYLQILGVKNEYNLTDKARADKLVKKLRVMARTYDVPVVAISSFNRENYNTPVNMAAFKESGGIEYTADALIGLQFGYMALQDGETLDGKSKSKDRPSYSERVRAAKVQAAEDKKNGKPLLLQAVVLKSRYSAEGVANISFLPRFNLYFEGVTPKAAAVDKELAKQAQGRGNIKAADVLNRYLVENKIDGDVILWSNRVQVRDKYSQQVKMTLEAVEGKDGLWTIKDSTTMQIIASVNPVK